MIMIAIPHTDFDPTEVVIPWKVLTDAGHQVHFATPTGRKGQADSRVLTGKGFGPLGLFMAAPAQNVKLYQKMERSPEFASPFSYDGIPEQQLDGMLLPGGHAAGMKEYLESTVLQKLVARMFALQKPVGAICHGVIVAARSKDPEPGRSVLYGRRTTALPKFLELSAWLSTCLWLGGYFKTYPESVQEIVTRELKQSQDFLVGPFSLGRDSMEKPQKGFAVVDGNYLSARWPGDAYRFAYGFLELLGKEKNLGQRSP